ncbi:MAG: flagellar brake protein [Pseudomonadota bacterium]
MTFDDNPDRYYTNPGDIFTVFRALQADRSTINVQFDEDGPLHNSLILEARLRERILLFDELTPASANERALAGETFSIRASVNGIRVYAPGLHVLSGHRDRSGIYYRVAFPDRLLYLQRRNAYRVPVPARLALTARCHFEDRPPQDAGLENLSATGVRLRLQGSLEPPLPPGASLRIRLPLPAPEQDVLELRCSMVHQQYDRGRQLTFCGCRFEDPGRAEQITLNRVVTQMQRDSLV